MIGAHSRSGRLSQRAVVAGTTAALALLGGFFVPSAPAARAEAAGPGSTGAAAPAAGKPGRVPGCDPKAQRAAVAAAIARTNRVDDQPQYSLRRLRRIDAGLRRRLAARSMSRPEARFGLVLRIPVAVHVLAGPRDPGPSKAVIRQELRVVNRAYDGGQSPANTPTPFSFQLVSIDRTVNAAWHHAVIFDDADKAARRTLHVGGPDELNLYISSPSTGNRRGNGVVLGWSSMPWWVHRPRLDGVTVNEQSLPGGRLLHFNRGDTAVHEIGHWLGLFHTFEGGCSRRNDRVADTPAEFSPSVGCPVGRDSCPAPGTDPVHNFMDYSFDTCMNRFTPDQVNRMTDNWLAYRTP